jgi:hypothetical protein
MDTTHTTNKEDKTMTKEKWIEHMEESGMVRPSRGGDKEAWKELISYHKLIGCESCKARAKTRKANSNRKAREDCYRSAGLVKVRGAVTGAVYWE